jgi:hypothetical protein
MAVALEIAEEGGANVVGGLHGAYLGLPRCPAKPGAKMRGKERRVLTMGAEVCPAEATILLLGTGDCRDMLRLWNRRLRRWLAKGCRGDSAERDA